MRFPSTIFCRGHRRRVNFALAVVAAADWRAPRAHANARMPTFARHRHESLARFQFTRERAHKNRVSLRALRSDDSEARAKTLRIALMRRLAATERRRFARRRVADRRPACTSERLAA